MSWLRVQNGSQTYQLSVGPSGSGHTGMGGIPKIQKNGQTYDIYLVETSDPTASPVRIQTNAGVKAIQYAQTYYTIAVSVGSGGSIVDPNNNIVTTSENFQVVAGGSATFTMMPNTGYQVSNVTTTNPSFSGDVSSYQFSNVQGNASISATFVQVYSISASAGSGGSITPSGSVQVSAGASQSFTVAANSGYSISQVSVDGVNQGAISSYTFSNVQSNHTISATFVQVYSISVSVGSGGSIVDPNNNIVTTSENFQVSYGGTPTFTMMPNAGYQVANVQVNGNNQGAIGSYQFSAVTQNQTISATFTPIVYTIAVSVGSGGSIVDPNSNVVTSSENFLVDAGGSATFTMMPNTGYQVSNVTTTNPSYSGVVSSYTFSNVQGNATISATFSPVCGTCNTSCQTGCQVACETGCQVSCQSACQTACQTACQLACQTCNTCQTTCELACQTGCQVACETGCQVACQTCNTCQTTCELACQTGCQVACQTCNTCQSACELACQTCNTCQTTCELACETGCQVACQTCNTCQTTCELACQTGCQVSCQTGCQVVCATGCQVTCETGCQIMCATGCQAACEVGCEVACETGCQVSCQTCNTCQTGCQVSCQTCNTSCQSCETACYTCCYAWEVCYACEVTCYSCEGCY